MTIDVLWNARAAVTKYPLEQRIRLYSLVSMRLTLCGVFYALINKEAPNGKLDPQTSASFDGISRVYTLAGSITYPETGQHTKACWKTVGSNQEDEGYK